MSHNKMDYETIIRNAGYRMTHQRIMILDAVCFGAGHTTLGEIYARVRAINNTMDRSTVYRTLKLFVKLGLVVSADTGTGDLFYEIAKPQRHHHFVCQNCGTEQKIEDEAFQGLCDTVFARYQFTVQTNHLILFGLCANCRTAELSPD